MAGEVATEILVERLKLLGPVVVTLVAGVLMLASSCWQTRRRPIRLQWASPPPEAEQLTEADRRKLDEYLDSVRDVEQRIANAGQRGELQGWKPTLATPDMPRPPNGIPQDIAEHMVVLGRAGGKLETGRVLDYSGKPDRQMCRLYLSLMEKMGVHEKTVGDATQPLDEV